MGDSLTNQSYVQGSAAGLDSADIARAVWNTPSANHVLTGSFGQYLDAQVSGIGSGSGAYSVDLVAYDSSKGQTVENVMLAIRSVDQSNLVAVARTSSTGRAGVNLDNDSYLSIASAPGYLFSAFDTIVVSGAGMDTVFGNQFDPGDPGSPSLCRVFGFLYTLQGDSERDALVSAYLPKGVVRTNDAIVLPNAVTSASDSAGYFYLDLIPSDSLIGKDTRYEITINRTDGTVLRKRLKVPNASSWQLTW